MITKTISATLVSIMIVLVACTPALADTPPPIYGIEIVEHENYIEQTAGTSSVYEIEVKNVGILGLEINLESERLPDDWFISTDKVNLEFNDTATLTYSLNIPEGESGINVFSLIAVGNYGVGETSDIVPVTVDIVNGGTVETTTTTTTVAEEKVIKLSELVENLTKVLDPEIFFSKFRTGVEYIRITARSVISNEFILYNAIIGLVAVIAVLVVIERLFLKK